MVVLVASGVEPDYVRKRYKGDFSFVCFTNDYLTQKKWEDALSPSFQKISIKSDLEKIKTAWREDFLSFVDTLGKDAHPLWPLTTLSEENTFVSNLFLDCVRLKIIDTFLSRGLKNIIVIVEDPFLFEELEKLGQKRGWEIKTKRDFQYFVKKSRVYFTPLFQLIKFIFTSYKHCYAARGVEKEKPTAEKGRCIILHTWVDDGAFTKEGKYKDRYFGTLIEWITKRGYHLCIAPFIYNTSRPLREVYKLLSSSGYNFIIAPHYYRFSDYGRCIKRAFKILSLTERIFYFSQLEITGLIKRDAYRQTFGLLPFFMYLDLFERLKERGFEFAGAIDVFEGMIPERTWIMGFKKAYPEGLTVAYQHTLFSKDLLCYFLYRGNALHEVLPARIVCTGEMVANFLKDEGLPEERLTPGGALRYEYLWKKKRELSAPINQNPPRGNRVLISLPLQQSGAMELMAICAKIATRRTEIEFFVKPHPMMKSAVLQEIIKDTRWPRSESSIAHGSMEEWVEKVNLIISTASAAVMDALTAGKPIIIVGREGVFDLNPLDWIDSPYTRTYYGEEEIEGRIISLLNLREEEMIELLTLGQRLLRGCFNPVTDETLSAFLPS